jgi:hypothetical protein
MQQKRARAKKTAPLKKHKIPWARTGATDAARTLSQVGSTLVPQPWWPPKGSRIDFPRR